MLMGGRGSCCCGGCVLIDRDDLPSSATIGAQTRYRADWTTADSGCCWRLPFFSIGSTYLNAHAKQVASTWRVCDDDPIFLTPRWAGACFSIAMSYATLIISKPSEVSGYCLRLEVVFTSREANLLTGQFTGNTANDPCYGGYSLISLSTPSRVLTREKDTTWPAMTSTLHTFEDTDHIDMPDFFCGSNNFFDPIYSMNYSCPGGDSHSGLLTVDMPVDDITFDIQIDN